SCVPSYCKANSKLKTHRSKLSQDLRCEGDYLHELLLAQLAGHGAEYTRAAWGVLGVYYDGCVVVEADVRAVWASVLLRGTHHDGAHDLALFHGPAGRRHLHRPDDDVAHAR